MARKVSACSVRKPKKHGIEELYDDIAIDNSTVNLFLQMGFVEEYRTPEIIMVKKRLLHM